MPQYRIMRRFTQSGRPRPDRDEIRAYASRCRGLSAVRDREDGVAGRFGPIPRPGQACADGMWRVDAKLALDRVVSAIQPEAPYGHKAVQGGVDGHNGHLVTAPDDEVVSAADVTAGKIGGPVSDHRPYPRPRDCAR